MIQIRGFGLKIRKRMPHKKFLNRWTTAVRFNSVTGIDFRGMYRRFV